MDKNELYKTIIYSKVNKIIATKEDLFIVYGHEIRNITTEIYNRYKLYYNNLDKYINKLNQIIHMQYAKDIDNENKWQDLRDFIDKYYNEIEILPKP